MAAACKALEALKRSSSGVFEDSSVYQLSNANYGVFGVIAVPPDYRDAEEGILNLDELADDDCVTTISVYEYQLNTILCCEIDEQENSVDLIIDED